MAGPRYLLFANGTWPKEAVWGQLVKNADQILACDGAAMKCAEHGVVVDAVLGDMDSIEEGFLNEIKNEQRTKVIPIVNQDSNDLVKSMRWAIENGASHLDILAVEGGDSGHHFAAVMALCEVPFSCKIHTDSSTIELLQKNPYIHDSIVTGTSFSLFAIGEVQGLSIKGSQWDVTSITLKPSTRGLHNTARSQRLEISWDNGTLLLFLNH